MKILTERPGRAGAQGVRVGRHRAGREQMQALPLEASQEPVRTDSSVSLLVAPPEAPVPITDLSQSLSRIQSLRNNPTDTEGGVSESRRTRRRRKKFPSAEETDRVFTTFDSLSRSAPSPLSEADETTRREILDDLGIADPEIMDRRDFSDTFRALNREHYSYLRDQRRQSSLVRRFLSRGEDKYEADVMTNYLLRGALSSQDVTWIDRGDLRASMEPIKTLGRKAKNKVSKLFTGLAAEAPTLSPADLSRRALVNVLNGVPSHRKPRTPVLLRTVAATAIALVGVSTYSYLTKGMIIPSGQRLQEAANSFMQIDAK